MNTELCMICSTVGPAQFECGHPDAHTPLPTPTQDANGEPVDSIIEALETDGAPNLSERMTTALQAVATIHYNDDGICGHCSDEFDREWPCPTMHAITTALWRR